MHSFEADFFTCAWQLCLEEEKKIDKFANTKKTELWATGRLTYFVFWAVYGTVPTIHWAVIRSVAVNVID
jgi:hypothetical protein